MAIVKNHQFLPGRQISLDAKEMRQRPFVFAPIIFAQRLMQQSPMNKRIAEIGLLIHLAKRMICEKKWLKKKLAISKCFLVLIRFVGVQRNTRKC